ncbi:S8 family serine peptidase [Paenibacillus sp. GCM10012307]|uniref:S8 family peptidase n=1 Tax=Paenibacillus roseus TaxID=2798579 RepID=A0A934JAV4_9BACL|nr:S8 family peptidase [Paenibacillus roseus]MBJ6363455.1 S8 family peptidase [Paenibacillus roseus]
MKYVNELLSHYTCRKPNPYSRRMLIGLKNRSLHESCCRYLRQQGIEPVKNIGELALVCCHLDTRKNIEALKRHPHVAFVEKDIKIRAHASKRHKPASTSGGSKKSSQRIIPWNINRIQAPQIWKTTQGRPVRLAILDTGIAKHPDLKVRGGTNTLGGASYRDNNGHGTHVAGIAAALGIKGLIAGTAPQVRLYAVKALDRQGLGYLSDIIEGLVWCVKHKMNVVNMSLGIPHQVRSRVFEKAVALAARNGIVLVCSAGNDGNYSGGIDAPASYPGTISVAASTRSNRIASFSSRGRGIDITAPGNEIRSTWLRGKYAYLSGTSMASPHVAGGAALLISYFPGLTPAAVLRAIKNGALKLKGISSLAQGSGLLQLERSVRRLSKLPIGKARAVKISR